MQVLRWKRLCRGGAHRLLACTATAPGCCVHPDGPAVTPEPQHSCLWFLLCMSLHPLSTWTQNSLPLSQVEISQKTAFDWFSKPPPGVNFSARKKARLGSIQASSPYADGCFWIDATPAWPRGRHHSSAGHSVLQGPRWTQSAWDCGQGITRGPTGPSCSQRTGME